MCLLPVRLRFLKRAPASPSTHCFGERALLGEVGEDEGPLLWHQLVFLHPELLQQLPASDRERGLEEVSPKDLGGFITGEAVTTLGNMAITQPPGAGGENE